MTVSDEIRAHIVEMCEGETKVIDIANIVAVSTRTMQTIIKQFNP
jgi:hypothetical protein